MGYMYMRLNARGQIAGLKELPEGTFVVEKIETGGWMFGKIQNGSFFWTLSEEFTHWRDALQHKIVKNSLTWRFPYKAYIRDSADGLYYSEAEMNNAYNF